MDREMKVPPQFIFDVGDYLRFNHHQKKSTRLILPHAER